MRGSAIKVGPMTFSNEKPLNGLGGVKRTLILLPFVSRGWLWRG
jgi:hypothetical protein